MKITMILATSENNVIGREGWMPWRQSADLKRFARLTMGHHIVLGRKTFDALKAPLPGRRHLVLTRRVPMSAAQDDQVLFFDRVQPVLEHAKRAGESELFITGGGEIYRLFLPLAETIELTRVHATLPGDIDFSFDRHDWRLKSTEGPFPANEKNDHPYTFETWVRELTQ
jgi:dihydrofolate reductase